MPGYLSLHQSTVSPTSLSNKKFGKAYSWLQLSWTPNDVMSAATNEKQVNKSRHTSDEYVPNMCENEAVKEEKEMDSGQGDMGLQGQTSNNVGDLKVADRE